jgi:predicted phage tail protein
MKSRKLIRGAGGEPDAPQQHVPSEAPDSLRSRAYLRIMDLISEGEIEGLVDGDRSVFLDETPLANADGSFNFAGVIYNGRTGTQDQEYIEGFSDVENEVEVSVEIRADVPVVRQITDPNVNRLRVRISIPALTTTSSGTGDIAGGSVEVAVDVQESGGSYVERAVRTVTGKASGQYQFELEVALTGDGPWNVRVRRNTPDSVSSLAQNKTYLAAITEIVDAKLRYPNSAVIGIRLDSQQFQSVPTRYYDVRGIKVQIPSNYNPATRAYTGAWDGTFSVAWSDNPAWVFYDLLTNARYGLGGYLAEDQIDKWALYTIARYCDELVPDGFGGSEPRFTCNLCIADAAEAYQVMQNLASVFRGMLYWSAGAVTATQDSPQDAAALFTRANVENGIFTYQGASAKARHSVALVTWNDPADFYRQKVEYVEDQEAIARFGIQQTNIVAFGCTSRAQAHRLGKWLLYTEQNESESVTFVTGLEGVAGRPGQIIKLADPTRAGQRMAGRIRSASSSVVRVDQDLVGAISGSLLSVMLANGSVEERTVIGSSGRAITVQPPFTSAPNAQSVWMLASSEIEPQTFRVIGVKEEGEGRYTVSAIRHDPGKFAFIEDGIALEAKSYSALKQAPSSPSSLLVTESLYQSTTEVKAKASVSWERVDHAASYIVRYRFDNNNFVEFPETQFTEQEILDVQPGTYTIQVTAINAIGKRSVPTEITQSLLGKTAPPSDVQLFSMIPNQGHAYLTWAKASDLDVLVGGQVRIRFTPRTTGQAWSDAVDIIPAVAGSATSAIAPLLAGTYMAKFLDSSGVYSESEALIVTTIPEALALNVVQTLTESPTFPGTKTDMLVDTTLGALSLASGMLIDDYPEIDLVGDWDFPGQILFSGEYLFQNTVDLGGVWATNIMASIDLEAYNLGNIIDSRFSPIDSWEDIDGETVADVNAAVYVRTTEDNPSGTPTWSDWKPIHAGSYSARGFQFKLVASTASPDHNLRIVGLSVTLDLDDRVVEQNGLSSGLGTTYRVNFAQPFYATPSISITGDAMGTGDYFTISNKSASGFDIVFKNAGGSIVSRTFNFIAKGYGRKVA